MIWYISVSVCAYVGFMTLIFSGSMRSLSGKYVRVAKAMLVVLTCSCVVVETQVCFHYFITKSTGLLFTVTNESFTNAVKFDG